MPTPRAADHTLVQLRRARDHVDRNFADPLDLDQLAAVAALSKYHFHRLFTATYGRTPAEHLAERRIERAQDLLRATGLTVTEVCMAVGYSSPVTFISNPPPTKLAVVDLGTTVTAGFPFRKGSSAGE